MNNDALDYLQNKGITHTALDRVTQTTHEAAKQLIRGVVLKDDEGSVMVLFRADHLLDIAELRDALHRELVPLGEDEKKNLLCYQENSGLLPLPSAYGLPGVLDSSVDLTQDLHFLSADTLVQIPSDEYRRLLGDAKKVSCTVAVSAIAVERDEDAHVNTQGDTGAPVITDFVMQRAKQRVEGTYSIPTMPAIASELLKLRVNPDANMDDLARIVERDPSLALQVMSWAHSPYYGYRGKIDSVEDAIIRVLGFDLVMNLAIGLALGKTLKVPREGKLGLVNYWRTAVHMAVLVENLSKIMGGANHPHPQTGMAYLSGLLYNFGILLVGHLFLAKFETLNDMTVVNSHVPLQTLEQHILGLNHQELGVYLLTTWNMPESIIQCVQHGSRFTDKKGYENPNLLFLATRLLKKLGIGYAPDTHIPVEVYHYLGLTVGEVNSLFSAFTEQLDIIQALSNEMLNE